jgi:high affinity sulfate transporter 1
VTIGKLQRFAPGIAMLMDYKPKWFGADFVAGLSVTAVALPTAIAYAQLAGFPPVIGLYAAILPLLAYAIFGTSRQLIVNPDAATCAMVAAIVAPLAGMNQDLYVALASALAIVTGIICIVAGLLRFGFLADFLGRPVLVGFLNGIAISIFLGQVGNVFGFSIETGRIIPRLIEFVQKLPETHLPTLALGAATFAILILLRRYLPKLPAPLIALVASVALVTVLRLDLQGVVTIGEVPAGLPALKWPMIPTELLPDLLMGAVGLALVSFTSGMVTARSFAARNHYEIDVDREFVALGACNISAGFSQGFAVTGADSRTAMNDFAGGKSQLTGIIAAFSIVLILLFLTEPLQYLPVCGLGAVLISAAWGLFDWKAIVRFHRIGDGEFAVCLSAMLGVVIFGALQGIIIAVALSLLVLLARSSRPPDGLLGIVPGMSGYQNISSHENATSIPGLLLYRFNASIIFFNAAYFRRRALETVVANPDALWLVIDGAPIAYLDSTGADTIAALAEELDAKGVRLIFAGAHKRVIDMLERSGAQEQIGKASMFTTFSDAVKAFEVSKNKQY